MVGSTISAETLLLERGADRIPHPGGTLLAHLRRVSDLLGTWEAGQDIQMAGLCHACYGTDGFAVALLTLDERPLLRDIIGARPEALVYLYASCDRAVVYPEMGAPGPLRFRSRFTQSIVSVPEDDAAAFVELTAANELDIAIHHPAWAEGSSALLLDLFRSASRRLSRAAWRECELTLGALGTG